jgi:hypothetical protein
VGTEPGVAKDPLQSVVYGEVDVDGVH